MTSLVRNSALKGYSAFVRAFGGNPGALLAQCDIAHDIEQRHDAFLPYGSLIRLLELSADQLNCPDFGMRFAKAQDIEILGPLAVVIRHSTTVQEAIEQGARYLHVFNPGQRLTMSAGPKKGEVRLRFEILLDDVACQRQANERALTFVRGITELGDGAGARPTQVLFAHRQLASDTAYKNVFGNTRFLFEQPMCCLDIEAVALQRSLTQANRYIRSMAIAFLEDNSGARQQSLATQVSEIVRRLLPTGELGIDIVAQSLNLTRRTLQRRLSAQDTRFFAIVDRERRKLAARYLLQGELPLTQLAAVLGYTEQSAFNRACRRWFGATPRAYRSKQLGGSSGPPTAIVGGAGGSGV